MPRKIVRAPRASASIRIPISKRFVKFNAEFDTFLAYLRDHDVRLGIGASVYGPLVDLWLEWEMAFAAYTGPDTGSIIIIHQIQNIHKDATQRMRDIRQYLKHRPMHIGPLNQAVARCLT